MSSVQYLTVNDYAGADACTYAQVNGITAPLRAALPYLTGDIARPVALNHNRGSVSHLLHLLQKGIVIPSRYIGCPNRTSLTPADAGHRYANGLRSITVLSCPGKNLLYPFDLI